MVMITVAASVATVPGAAARAKNRTAASMAHHGTVLASAPRHTSRYQRPESGPAPLPLSTVMSTPEPQGWFGRHRHRMPAIGGEIELDLTPGMAAATGERLSTSLIFPRLPRCAWKPRHAPWRRARRACCW